MTIPASLIVSNAKRRIALAEEQTSALILGIRNVRAKRDCLTALLKLSPDHWLEVRLAILRGESFIDEKLTESEHQLERLENSLEYWATAKSEAENGLDEWEKLAEIEAMEDTCDE